MIKRKVLIGLFIFVLVSGYLFAKQSEIYIETKIKPSSKFEEAKIKSVAILNFDANNLKTLGGKVVNYLALSKMFSDDLIKKIYVLGKIDVALGQYEDSVVEKTSVTKKKGDLYLNSSSLERSVKYNCLPYKKIQAVLTGSINEYRKIGDGRGKSYINVTLKLTDTYDGTVYWITDMKGYYKDVIHTIAYTLSSGKYEEPVEVIESTTSGKSKQSKKAAIPEVKEVAPQSEEQPQNQNEQAPAEK